MRVEHEAHGDRVPELPVGSTVVAQPTLDGKATGAIEGYRCSVVRPHLKEGPPCAGRAHVPSAGFHPTADSRPPMPCLRWWRATIMPSEPHAMVHLDAQAAHNDVFASSDQYAVCSLFD